MIFASASTTHSPTPTPAPIALTCFPLPLADGSTANAIILPIPDGAAYLIYTTNDGKIGIYQILPVTSIAPTPDPAPTPSRPQTLIIVTEIDPAKLNDPVKNYLDAKGITLQTFTIMMVEERNPPANSLKWIGRTAGRPYPYAFIIDKNETILWKGQLPQTAKDTIAIFDNLLSQPMQPTTCPTNLCPIPFAN